MPVDRKIVDDFFGNFSGSDSYEKEGKNFGKRISTYIEGQKWVRRPLVISPAVCSQYGWKCINSNLLECETCGAKLSIPEPEIEIYDAYKACIEKILENLKASHKVHCPWPLTPAPECFLRILPMPREESLKLFMKRLKPSLEFHSDIPRIKDKIPALLGLKQNHVVALYKLAGINAESVGEFEMSIVSLASTGWTLQHQGYSNEEKVFVTCNDCQRSIWSRAFNTLHDEKSEEASISQNCTENSLAEASPTSKSKRIKKDDFDPLEEHRPWCLWIAAADLKQIIQSGSDATESEKAAETENTPGWKFFIESLLRNAYDPQESDLKSHPSKEQIRSVRDLLETWTEAAE